MTSPISVHVWSDVACPWCFIGKRRFEHAVEQFDGEVQLEYHAFQLAPETPVEFEGDEVEFLAEFKRMPVEQVKLMISRVRDVAAGEGLNYDFEALHHTNTLMAHQAIHFAKAQGKQLEFIERLFSAYFEEGRHIGRVDELVELARDVDVDAEGMREALDAQTYARAVENDFAIAAEIGIAGVPFYVIDQKFGVSGAQDPAVFLEALQQAAAEREGVIDVQAR